MTSLALTLQPVAAHPAFVRMHAWFQRHRREAAGGLGVATAVLAGFSLIANNSPSELPRASAPAEPAAVATVAKQAQTFTPFQVRDVAPDKAVALNAAVPVASGPNPAALPFVASSVKSTAYLRALTCLTQGIYYEAARESEEGQRAVAQVILNRVRHPAFPSSVCGVVFQGSERPTGCQFSFTCDGSLYSQPMRSYWDRARKLAHEALQGYVYAPVGNATHYHANYVVPYWAPTLTKNAVVGAHIFYRWKGGWGQPNAFSQRYSKHEADPYALRSLALAAEAREQAVSATAAIDSEDVPEAVVEAKRELPPELAKLVAAETTLGGDARLTMRLPAGKPGQPVIAATPPTMGSASSQWSMSGQVEGTAPKPLGKPVAPPAKAAAIPPSAKVGAPVTSAGGEE
ncbi:cell wall hydrolase [Sphingomonas sp. BN140010]|uniref:Cell wall hydrolase n=1 Tax=Sphingomonas arvum TaxID=2992113 RepID=A0ABT3JE01_9SPHN|nr:cell wall hydrolase [Sphingomonas sp. BN140010]MCW3797302.1 cell wall hydrolase [Sphingomonas sp. BN140010]